MASSASKPRLWWQDGVIYQVYPRSFQDSDGDGVGDLNGIASRLDYLVELGIDAVWISPFYTSPMADFGYDVSDYTGVDPLFGTLADFDRLLTDLHARGLKLILDFVPNHSSDQHPWFLESRSSRTSPRRNWYLWHDPATGGGVPNNWLSNLGGSAWTFDELTGQFYLHSFLSAQPDLNWRNPEVEAAIFAAMRFWLDRGVDGFRMDVLWLLLKDDQFRSNPPNPAWTTGDDPRGQFLRTYNNGQPETIAIVQRMRSLLDLYPDRVLIGEIYLPLPQLVTFYGDPGTPGLRGADLPFNFQLILSPWNADRIADLIRTYEGLLPPGAWPNWVLGNHDQSRLASRIGAAQVRVAAMLLLTLRGTPTLYNGDELALPDAVIPPGQVQDPAERNQPGIGMGRDPERSPIPWDTTPGLGFTTGTPWLPFVPDAAALAVSVQTPVPRSVLSLYRQLLDLRRSHPALHAGDVFGVRAEDGVLSFTRTSGDQRLHVLLNLTCDLRHLHVPAGRVLLTSILDGSGAEVGGAFVLEAGEGVVLDLTPA